MQGTDTDTGKGTDKRGIVFIYELGHANIISYIVVKSSHGKGNELPFFPTAPSAILFRQPRQTNFSANARAKTRKYAMHQKLYELQQGWQKKQ